MAYKIRSIILVFTGLILEGGGCQKIAQTPVITLVEANPENESDTLLPLNEPINTPPVVPMEVSLPSDPCTSSKPVAGSTGIFSTLASTPEVPVSEPGLDKTTPLSTVVVPPTQKKTEMPLTYNGYGPPVLDTTPMDFKIEVLFEGPQQAAPKKPANLQARKMKKGPWEQLHQEIRTKNNPPPTTTAHEVNKDIDWLLMRPQFDANSPSGGIRLARSSQSQNEESLYENSETKNLEGPFPEILEDTIGSYLENEATISDTEQNYQSDSESITKSSTDYATSVSSFGFNLPELSQEASSAFGDAVS